MYKQLAQLQFVRTAGGTLCASKFTVSATGTNHQSDISRDLHAVTEV